MNLNTFKPSYFFKRLRMNSFQRKLPDAPWLTENAVYILNSWLKPSDKGFEWGSGRSTLWLANRSASLVSIEHHEGWYNNVSSMLKNNDLYEKVEYFRIDDGEEYESKIDEYDYPFDYILIDGRRRLQCLKKAISKVKMGGILILDNSDRYIPNNIGDNFLSVVNKSCKFRNEDWEKTIQLMSEWRQFQTSDGINDSTIWMRPG